MTRWRSAVPAALVAAGSLAYAPRAAAQPAGLGWKTTVSRTLRYQVTRDKAAIGADYTETDQLRVIVRIKAGGATTLAIGNDPPVQFTLARDGSHEPEAVTLPFLASILLRLASPALDPSPGATWEARVPSDAYVAGQDDKVCVQRLDRHRVVRRLTVAGEQLHEVSLEGQMRVVDNSFAREMVAAVPVPERAEAAAALARLAEWNHSIVGTYRWSRARGALVSADLTLALVPAARPSPDDVRTSIIRNRLRVRLLP